MCDELSDIDDCLDALLDNDDDDDDDFIEIECPHCGDTVFFDQSMLEGDEPLVCPSCNEPVIPAFDVEDVEDDEDGDEDEKEKQKEKEKAKKDKQKDKEKEKKDKDKEKKDKK